MKRKITFILGGIGLLISTPSFAWVDSCGKAEWKGVQDTYCRCTGMDIYDNNPRLKAFWESTGKPMPPVGKVIGVAWRPKGSLISPSGVTSPRNAFYYIVDDKSGPPFLKDPRRALFADGSTVSCNPKEEKP